MESMKSMPVIFEGRKMNFGELENKRYYIIIRNKMGEISLLDKTKLGIAIYLSHMNLTRDNLNFLGYEIHVENTRR